jgi:hypothetical protein
MSWRQYKISTKSTSRFKSCTHLRSLKARHWILWSRGHLQCHHLHTRLHPNSPIYSKVIKGFLCAHLRSLNVLHFGTAEATRWKYMASRSSWMARLRNKFHENPPTGSKVVSGGDTHTHTHTHRPTGLWFDKPNFIFGKQANNHVSAKDIQRLYETRMFITVCTTAHDWFLSQARWLRSTTSHARIRSILILSSYLRQWLRRNFFPSETYSFV